jgi:hypothetical protein
MKIARIAAAMALALGGCASQAIHDPSQHAPHAAGDAADGRELVRFPDDMRIHTLANMRDHLATLEQINRALAGGEYERAAELAEKRLGMTSLEAHGAAHLAGFMPQGMQQIGSGMHRAASRFAIEAQNASLNNDPKTALRALGEVMQQCVACHAAYRLQ